MKLRHVAPLLAVPALLLASCSGTGAASTDEIQIVASTNVYGQIAEVVAGNDAKVTSIITSAAQDPHDYEPSSKDKLTVSHADLIVANGGGYDAFINGLISNDKVPVIEASTFAADYPTDGSDHAAEHTHEATEEPGHEGHDHAHIEGFNEHVWYDPAIAASVAEDIAKQLGTIDPTNKAAYEERAAGFTADVATLQQHIETVAGSIDHSHILVTEPVSLRLTDLLGLHNVTPPAFSEAVEEGQDVAPAVLLSTLNALKDEDVKVVIANMQTGGAETERVIKDAKSLNIPVLEFSEVKPADKTYIEWMTENVDALAKALGA